MAIDGGFHPRLIRMNGFWHWWTDGLSAPLPRALRRQAGSGKGAVWADAGDAGITFRVRRRGGWKTIATVEGNTIPAGRLRRRLSSSPVILRVPGDQAIVRSFPSPPDGASASDAESRLAEISPLPADQQYFDSFADNGGLTLAVVRKSWMDARITELGALGLDVSQATVEGLEDSGLNLLPGALVTRRKVDYAGLALVAVGILFCTGVYQVTVWQQHETLSKIEGRQQELQHQLSVGQPVRDRTEQLRNQAAAIADRKIARPSPLSLLAAVTRATPDHAWVRQWILDGNGLTLLGETTDTAGLIASLEASPLLSEVQYESAITRDPGNDRERYRISAEVVPK